MGTLKRHPEHTAENNPGLGLSAPTTHTPGAEFGRTFLTLVINLIQRCPVPVGRDHRGGPARRAGEAQSREHNPPASRQIGSTSLQAVGDTLPFAFFLGGWGTGNRYARDFSCPNQVQPCLDAQGQREVPAQGPCNHRTQETVSMSKP